MQTILDRMRKERRITLIILAILMALALFNHIFAPTTQAISFAPIVESAPEDAAQ